VVDVACGPIYYACRILKLTYLEIGLGQHRVGLEFPVIRALISHCPSMEIISTDIAKIVQPNI
jgi:hypothetical protein